MLPAQNFNIEALLAHVPLFNGLENEEIARIARGTREVNVIRGDMLFHKGDVSTGFHLIVWGEPSPAEVAAAIKDSLADIAERVTWADVPGVSAVECGNYRDHSLHSAREWCKLVLEQGISVDAFDRTVLA